MTAEKLEKAVALQGKIMRCKREIEKANYTQYEDVVIRETALSVNGLDEDVRVPESLFRVIGKLIIYEYQCKLKKLEDEFNAL